MAKTRLKAVGYLRCSGLGQDGGDAWNRQRAACEKHASKHGLAIVDWFRDTGVSGTKGVGDRPGLAALLDRIESNGIRIVLIENASRLARDLLVSEVILAQFRAAGCAVICCSSGLDLAAETDADPTRRLIRQVLGAVSEFDRRVTVAKLKAARDRIRARDGRCEGRKPYGARPHEVAVIHRIRELYRKPHGRARRSFQAIADTLNAELAPTRTGRPWSKQTVFGIVRRGL